MGMFKSQKEETDKVLCERHEGKVERKEAGRAVDRALDRLENAIDCVDDRIRANVVKLKRAIHGH